MLYQYFEGVQSSGGIEKVLTSNFDGFKSYGLEQFPNCYRTKTLQ